MRYNYFKKLSSSLFIIPVIIVLFSSRLNAQTQAASVPTGVTTHIDKFFKSYDKQGTSRAVIDIFKTNSLMDTTRLTGLISKIDSMRAIIGKYTGKDLIVQRKASNSLILYSYLVKHETQPARITFMFYKPKTEWVIYRLFFDVDVDSELAESSRINGKQ